MPHTINEAAAHPAFKLKYKGVFDYNQLSTFLTKWVQDRQYELTEAKHKHKYSCPHGFEIERDILGHRKIDDYFMYKIEIKLHMWDAFEVDAVKDGKKVKLWNARIEIQLGFDVVCDYQGRWDKNQYLKKLHENVYCQYLIKKEIIILHADPLFYKMLSLHEKIKQFLGMETGTKFK